MTLLAGTITSDALTGTLTARGGIQLYPGWLFPAT